MSEFRRGDIVFVENPLQNPHGHVVCGNRPALIIQNEAGNFFSGNLIVAYITSQMKKLKMPTHVVLQCYPGLKKISVVQAEQLATISKNDVFGIIDHLRPEDMLRVDKALITSLSLGEVS